MQIIELWPLSQGEIDREPDGFVEAVFRDGAALRHSSALTRLDYARRVVRGGFPEAVARQTLASRRRFLTGYLNSLIEREVLAVADVANLPALRQMLSALAARTGSPLVIEPIANDLRIAAATARRYLSLLEEIFVIKRTPAWSRNLNTRATATPKLTFVDSGVAAVLLGEDETALTEPTSKAFGPLLENFVTGELLRQLSWSDEPIQLFHYRTRDHIEVDLVLEHARGTVVGLEVKAAASIRAEDFRGLRHLAERVGDNLVAGIVLYAGRETISLGPKLLAMPLSAIWQTPAPPG